MLSVSMSTFSFCCGFSTVRRNICFPSPIGILGWRLLDIFPMIVSVELSKIVIMLIKKKQKRVHS